MMACSKGAQREQVLIRWSNQKAIPDSWEDKLELQAHFLASTAWGQAVSQEEGDVSPTDIAGPSGSVTGKKGPCTGGSTRPRRQQHVNPRYNGLDWANHITMGSGNT